MAWRALLRRVPTRSMTIVGDLAQASRGRAGTWATSLDRPLRGSWRLAELTVNYRTPASVMDLATEVASAAGHPTGTVRSARDVPDAVRVSHAGRDAGSSSDGASSDGATADGATFPGASFDERLTGAVLAAVETELHSLDGGRIALIVPRARREPTVRALAAAATQRPALADALAPRRASDPMSARLIVLDPVESKGLEFDVVVVAEPAEIAGTGRDRRPGDLYVAMTRATRRLHVVAAGELPAGLSADQDRFGRPARTGGR